MRRRNTRGARRRSSRSDAGVRRRAFAANTGTVAIWHTPMVLGGSTSSTLHITLPQATDPIAAINIFVPTGYTAEPEPGGRTRTSARSTRPRFSHDNNLTLPLSGNVTTDAPANHTADSTACARTATSAAVWILNLSVAGQTIALPLYVNPTAGAEQALGATSSASACRRRTCRSERPAAPPTARRCSTRTSR